MRSVTNPITAGVAAGKRTPPRYSRGMDKKFGTAPARAGSMKGKPARFKDMSKSPGKGTGKINAYTA